MRHTNLSETRKNTMKCLNCGCINDHYLCDACLTPETLEKTYYSIRAFDPETCENPYLLEFAATCTEKYEERKIIPEILARFDFEVAEYFYCQYYRMIRDDRFEEAALAYLEKHDVGEIRSQRILYALLDTYIPDNFVKPQRWCETITATAGLCCDLYLAAAKFYAMIAEYERADQLLDQVERICMGSNDDSHLLYLSPEGALVRIEKQRTDVLRYRTKKPYWPTTEARRRAVAMFYDAKGIKYPRIEGKPKKVNESEFAPIKECLDDELTDYCAFWCAEAFGLTSAKDIYQIAAVRVRSSEVVDTFESYIRPWDGGVNTKKAAAKEAGVPMEVIEGADDVDLVIPKFFSFVGNDVLVSTGALGTQAKLISRAARYTGMKEIVNEFYDLLDLAADTSADFDLANNTREYLLTHFSIEEGKSALEKAMLNKQLFDALMSYGD